MNKVDYHTACGIFFILIVATFLSLPDSICFAQRVVNANEIESIVFNLYKASNLYALPQATKQDSTIEGYAIFLDRNRNQCTISDGGTLFLYRKFKAYEIESKPVMGGGIVEEKVVKIKTEHIKNIEFSPKDFMNLRLRSGDTIYALPIILNSNAVNPGDTVVLEWHGITTEININ